MLLSTRKKNWHIGVPPTTGPPHMNIHLKSMQIISLATYIKEKLTYGAMIKEYKLLMMKMNVSNRDVRVLASSGLRSIGNCCAQQNHNY